MGRSLNLVVCMRIEAKGIGQGVELRPELLDRQLPASVPVDDIGNDRSSTHDDDCRIEDLLGLFPKKRGRKKKGERKRDRKDSRKRTGAMVLLSDDGYNQKERKKTSSTFLAS